MAVVTGVEETASYLEARTARLRAIVVEVVQDFAPQVKTAMVANHRWLNRTGTAEALLDAYVEDLGTWVLLWAESGASYAIWLETRTFRHAGRLDIVLPTIRQFFPLIVEEIQRRWQAELGAAT